MKMDLKALREVVERIVQNPDSVDGMADFVATFDPPTVKALLDRLEAAEKALAIGKKQNLPNGDRRPVNAVATHDAHGTLLPKPNIPQVTG